MKQMKHLRLTALLMLVLTALVLFTACSPSKDIGLVDDLTEEFLDFLFANDYDSAYAMIKEYATDAEFEPYWKKMRTAVEGATSYEMKLIGWNINSTNGQVAYIGTFEITLDNGHTLYFRTTTFKGVEGIAGIYFHDATKFNATVGVFARIANIVLSVISLLFVALTIWMLVDCIRRKVKLKWLWILLILLSATFSLTVGQQFGINVGIGLFFMLSGVSANPAALTVTVKLIFPIGTIVYFFLRKFLTVTPPPEVVEEPIESIESAETEETTEPTNPAEPTVPAEAEEPTESADLAQTAELTDPTETTENTDTAE